MPLDYDEWKTSTPQDREVIIVLCEYCNGEIYEGEECLKTNEGIIHDTCFFEFAYEVLEVSIAYAERSTDHGEHD